MIDIFPTSGSHFAYMRSMGDVGDETSLTAVVSANAGVILSFDILFDTGDFSPYGGDARVVDVTINSPESDTSETLYSIDLSTVGDFGQSPWFHIVHTFATTGLHSLSFVVRQGNPDPTYQSALAVDNIRVCDGS